MLKHATLGNWSVIRNEILTRDTRQVISQSKSRLDALATLPSVSGLEGLPARYGTGFDTDHVLVSLIWAKIGHPLGLLDPRVPNYNIIQSLSSDREQRAVVFSGGNIN